MSAHIPVSTDQDPPLAESPAVGPPSLRARPFRLLLALLVLGCGYVLWTAILHSTRAFIPEELLGYWRSATEQYDDRYLYFAEQAVALGRGAVAESEGFPVESVEWTSAGPDRHITVVYRQHDGTRDQLHLVYHNRTKTLAFRHQPALIWTKYRSRE